jgi:hypothetical protein
VSACTGIIGYTCKHRDTWQELLHGKALPYDLEVTHHLGILLGTGNVSGGSGA